LILHFMAKEPFFINSKYCFISEGMGCGWL
jgi:hypothetical protein